MTQFFLYSPVNFRPVFGIERGRNPKGLALWLLSILRSWDSDHVTLDRKREAGRLLEWLREAENRSFHGPSWGYDFPWQDLHKFIGEGEPSVVVTCFVERALSFMQGHDLFGDHLETLRGIGEFILNDLNRFEDGDGVCLSYSPHDRNIVHNANMLGAAALVDIHRWTGDNRYLDLARKCVDFSLAKQHEDGSWSYSQTASGKERDQIDFHQGFVLESLMDMVELGFEHPSMMESLERGMRFYRGQFSGEGRSTWRHPRRWPVDIHNQAQGIITFSRYSRFDEGSLEMARKIFEWTVRHMYLGKGRFAYQIWPILKNRMSYARWGNAWMALASAVLADAEKGGIS